MKILIVEDEAKTAAYLQKGLNEHGYVTDLAHDGEDGLFLARTSNYDLIILDAMMPKLDGWTMISELRKSGSNSLAMFLTARDSLADRVRGLEAGADAYLVKPFSFTELLAQVKTLLRRSPTRRPEVFTMADLEVDYLQHFAKRARKRIELTPKEFALLSLFCRRAGDVLTRNLIADQVWNINFDSDTNVVDVHVARLRAKIDSGFDRKLIHTIRGMGYVLRDDGD